MEFGQDFEQQCEEYLSYLYGQAEHLYSDCTDLDVLVQDSFMAFIDKLHKGEAVEHPKGFLTAVLKNKYNGWLREKYKKSIVEYSDDTITNYADVIEDKEQAELQSEEYTSVRREIGRLIRIYREVTVRHYVHGHTVDQIAMDLKIPRGTVLSRLSTARDQIKEGLENMEKYSQFSYEPKSVRIGIFGHVGIREEPHSLISSDIESNILILAYENPVSVRGIADTMGMPSAYIEQTIEKLVKGELMGRTSSGLVYTRCFMQRYEDSFGDIPAQEKLAEKYASQVWDIAWKHFEPLTKRAEFEEMTEKQKATLLLFLMHQILGKAIDRCVANYVYMPKEIPERPNGGRWLAMGTITENGQSRDNIYDASGPVMFGYSKEENEEPDCIMADFQSVFGEAHYAYKRLKYDCSLRSILRFFASFLPCDVKTDKKQLYELIPDFEKLGIFTRDADGEARLDIPALTFEEAECWTPACQQIEAELYALLSEDMLELWLNRKNRVPKHVDEAAFYQHMGALGAYTIAQLLAIVDKGLMPYPVVVGKTPLIHLVYRKTEEK